MNSFSRIRKKRKHQISSNSRPKNNTLESIPIGGLLASNGASRVKYWDGARKKVGNWDKTAMVRWAQSRQGSDIKEWSRNGCKIAVKSSCSVVKTIGDARREVKQLTDAFDYNENLGFTSHGRRVLQVLLSKERQTDLKGTLGLYIFDGPWSLVGSELHGINMS